MSLRRRSLSQDWYELAETLCEDLKPLGRQFRWSERGTLTADAVSEHALSEYWEALYDAEHKAVLHKHATDIHEFERDYAAIFVDMRRFRPNRIDPVLEIADFRNGDHQRLLRYLRLSQSVQIGRRVGREMAILVWDNGQPGCRPLIGGTVLVSPRFSQRVRDHHFGWQPDFPATSRHFDPDHRRIREIGLERMMHLSLVCALPPYHFLAGAWLIATAPFTATGREAFERSVKQSSHALKPDLAAVVTTSGKGKGGMPFRRHRVAEFSAAEADGRAHGHLYRRARPAPGDIAPRACFEKLVSAKARDKALALFASEAPDRSARLRDPRRSALAFALRRLGLTRAIFDANEIGIHVGMLGRHTREYLRDGVPRPPDERPMLQWERIVASWRGKFIDGHGESDASLHPRNLEAASIYPQSHIGLSHLLSPDTVRLRLADLAPPRD